MEGSIEWTAWLAAKRPLYRWQEDRGQGCRAEELQQLPHPYAKNVCGWNGEPQFNFENVCMFTISYPLTLVKSGIGPAERDHCMQGEIGDEEFKEYFSQYGDIEDSVVSCTALSGITC